jgi:hypothetical protein
MTAAAESASSCPVCREIFTRSTLYERWLAAENFGDTATLNAAAAARGFCSMHARRVVELDPDITAPIARFVLHALSAALSRQREDRRGYRNALLPQALCPWCGSEREALDYALTDRKRRRAALCPPHAQNAMLLEKHHALIAEPPFRSGQGLDPPSPRKEQVSAASWWSPAVDFLWEKFQTSCAVCSAALEASRRREEFLRAGPQPNEHWDIPVLCVAHYYALGAPGDAAFRHAPDGIARACDWCHAMEQAVERTADLFAIAYHEPSFRLAYASVPGLCVPHAANVASCISAHGLDNFLTATSARIDAAAWELEELARRRSWHLRDLGAFAGSIDVAYRAWWLIAGGMKRSTGRDNIRGRE